MEETVRKRIASKKELGLQQEEKRHLERQQEDDRKTLVEVKTRLCSEEELCRQFDKEISERKNILRYLEIGENQLLIWEKSLQNQSGSFRKSTGFEAVRKRRRRKSGRNSNA